MNMKVFFGVLLLAVIGFIIWSPSDAPNTEPASNQTATEQTDDAVEMSERSTVSEGEYTVNPEASTVSWAGKKPLIEGYINTGSIAVTDGSISVTPDGATGVFNIDMDTLSVSDTPTKPGSESTLEGHLKGERWFDVETYPTANFEITNISPRAGVATSFMYDVTGQLTMKGVTDTVTFPAMIYQEADGILNASADFEFDRTKWGITSASGSFFDDLADNVIDDMVSLSFSLVAEPK